MTTLDDLNKLTEVRYQREQQALKVLVVKETALRAELARLSEQEADARCDSGQTAPMRPIGADVLWLGWVARTKAQLNLALAQILAQKEHHLAQVRRAYGKVLVTEELARLDHAARRKAQRVDQMRRTEAHVVFSDRKG